MQHVLARSRDGRPRGNDTFRVDVLDAGHVRTEFGCDVSETIGGTIGIALDKPVVPVGGVLVAAGVTGRKHLHRQG